MSELTDFLQAIKQAAEMDLDNNKKMGENHMAHSQEVIANLAALDAIEGNPAKHIMEVMKELQGNPT